MLIGLTGGIGSGKSVVAKLLKVFGFEVYDSDERAKFLTENNLEIREKLTEAFGAEVYENHRLNRAFLAQKIFSSKENLEKANFIIHPIVKRDLKFWASEREKEICFVESAIIFESGLNEIVEKIIVVSAPLERRFERILLRDSCTKEQAKMRISAQKDENFLLKNADFIVKNDENSSLIFQTISILEMLKN